MIAEFLQPDNSIDVIPEGFPDYELFFGPLLPDTKPLFLATIRTSDLLLALNLVISKTWCRKNNWDRELLPGYQEIVFGTKRVKICVFK